LKSPPKAATLSAIVVTLVAASAPSALAALASWPGAVLGASLLTAAAALFSYTCTVDVTVT